MVNPQVVPDSDPPKGRRRFIALLNLAAVATGIVFGIWLFNTVAH
jgi:hypothetical protein